MQQEKMNLFSFVSDFRSRVQRTCVLRSARDGHWDHNNRVYCSTTQGGRLSGLMVLSLKQQQPPVNKNSPRPAPLSPFHLDLH